jgi:hypothetical protein
MKIPPSWPNVLVIVGTLLSGLVFVLKIGGKTFLTKKPVPKEDESSTKNLVDVVVLDKKMQDSVALEECNRAIQESIDFLIQMEMEGENTGLPEDLNLKPEESPPVLDPFTEDQAGSSETWSPSAMF